MIAIENEIIKNFSGMKELVTSLAFTHFHLPQFARSSQDFAKSKLEDSL